MRFLCAWKGSAPAQAFAGSQVLCHSLLPPALALLQRAGNLQPLCTGNLQPLRTDLISRVLLLGWSTEVLTSGRGEGAPVWAGRALPQTSLQLGMG